MSHRQKKVNAEDGEDSSSPNMLTSLFKYLNGAEEKATAGTSSLPSTLALISTLFALLLRYLVSGGSYSGFSTPPMFGDYEAQRHWMEITINLPVQSWYFNGTNNNLQYWGLDYPPLTAYVSYAFGLLARAMGEGELVALNTSHGYQSVSSKYFMRLSVLICDILVFIPALYLAITAISQSNNRGTATGPSSWRRQVCYYLIGISPLFILIDHGHFQYNCFCLGLVCWAIWFMYRGNQLLSSVAFVLALAFKQMALYYAPAFFFYLLRRTLVGSNGTRAPLSTALKRLILIGGVVIATFLIMFAPFLYPFPVLAQVFHRMFPFARGLFEDKVANFWCATSVVFKWQTLFEREVLVKFSLMATSAAFMPNCIHVLLHPSRKSFLHALVGCAWAFFIFSFQVHEKTVLLPMLPLSLLIESHPLLVAWSTSIATFSMYPLLEKDGHAWSYAIMQVFFACNALSYARSQLLTPSPSHSSHSVPASRVAAFFLNTFNALISPMVQYRLVQLSLLGAAMLHVVWVVMPANPRLPDLKVMFFVLYAAAHFALFYLVNLLQQWSIPVQDTEDQEFQTQSEWQQKKSKSQ